MADYFTNDNPLQNKLGISDSQLLHKAEETIVADKTAGYLLSHFPRILILIT